MKLEAYKHLTMFSVLRRTFLKDIAVLETKRSKISRHVLKRALTTEQAIISNEACKEFNENGVVCLRNVFDTHWLELVERGVLKNLKSPSKYHDWLVDEAGGGLYFNDYYNCKRITEYLDYVMDSPAARIAKQAMNSEKVALFHEHVFYKEGGSTKETPWHHDQAYYPLNGMKNCSIWMPTSHIPKQSSLKFIKGSHKLRKLFVPRHFANNANYEVTKVLDDRDDICDIKSIHENLREENILQWEIEPGDCILFHMKTIHGTETSLSDQKRIVISTRWLGDDITYRTRAWKTSPPEELLPGNIKLGDVLVENSNLVFPLD